MAWKEVTKHYLDVDLSMLSLRESSFSSESSDYDSSESEKVTSLVP